MKQISHLAHVFVVFLRGDQTHAGCGALPHKVVQAGAHAVFHGLVGAAPQRKGPVDELPRFARGQCRSKGAKIARAVAPGLTHNFKPGKGMLGIDAKKHVLLVVAQHDIVVGPVLFDATGLEQQGFFFCSGGQVFDAHGMRKHGAGFGGQALWPKIREHPAAQHACLAHIDDAALGILIKIHTGREGNAGRFGLLHGRAGVLKRDKKECAGEKAKALIPRAPPAKYVRNGTCARGQTPACRKSTSRNGGKAPISAPSASFLPPGPRPCRHGQKGSPARCRPWTFRGPSSWRGPERAKIPEPE